MNEIQASCIGGMNSAAHFLSVERGKAANDAVPDLTLQRTDGRAASDGAYKTFVRHGNTHAPTGGRAKYAAFIGYADTEIGRCRQEVLCGEKRRFISHG